MHLREGEYENAATDFFEVSIKNYHTILYLYFIQCLQCFWTKQNYTVNNNVLLLLPILNLAYKGENQS